MCVSEWDQSMKSLHCWMWSLCCDYFTSGRVREGKSERETVKEVKEGEREIK